MTETCLSLKECADLLRISPRTLDHRHKWQPPFPQPIMRRPLVWRRADIDEWIRRRSEFFCKRVRAA